MSERKTTEIKLRVTPDEKARWQIEAERQGIALSELIRQTMNGLIQNQTPLSATSVLLGDGTRDIIHVVLGEKEAHPIVTPFGPYGPMPFAPGYAVIKNLTDGSDPEPSPVAQSDDSPQEDVPTSDEADSLGDEQPKSWMYEGRSGV